MRTRVKICGLTRLEDVRVAISCGVDAIGLVFYPPSPRAISVDQARELVRDLPPFVTVTALFVNEQHCRIEQILGQLRIDLLQFHGDESPSQCDRYKRPWIKALRMREGLDLMREKARFRAASGLLLDAYTPGLPGGTGSRFDWRRIPAPLRGEIILAGGLDAANVAGAIREVAPYAVDVSGGVERSKGVKDAKKIAAFMRGVVDVDN
jgi:phosphoribosylanthranilate isomerase